MTSNITLTQLSTNFALMQARHYIPRTMLSSHALSLPVNVIVIPNALEWLNNVMVLAFLILNNGSTSDSKCSILPRRLLMICQKAFIFQVSALLSWVEWFRDVLINPWVFRFWHIVHEQVHGRYRLLVFRVLLFVLLCSLWFLFLIIDVNVLGGLRCQRPMRLSLGRR